MVESVKNWCVEGSLDTLSDGAWVRVSGCSSSELSSVRSIMSLGTRLMAPSREVPGGNVAGFGCGTGTSCFTGSVDDRSLVLWKMCGASLRWCGLSLANTNDDDFSGMFRLVSRP